VKLVDPATGLVVPRGEPGELCTRGYSVMLGYWDEPAKTAEAKIPRYVLLVDEFPMTVTGKIRKVEMRERSVGLLGLRTLDSR
jgi:fatty-acyl-CoA synthase